MPDTDDPWDDLYKDLGVTGEAAKPTAPVADLLPPPVAAFDPDSDDDGPDPEPFAAGLADADGGDDDGDGEDGDELQVAGETNEDGTPGDPTKKRRRRRRRRKKGKAGEPGAEGTPDAPVIAATPAVARREPAPRPMPVAAPVAFDADDESADEIETANEPLATAEEETSPEAARELISTWNVPSWEEIVTGLYRPDR